MSYHKHKQGDTFDKSGYFEDPPETFDTTWTGACHITDDDGNVIAELTFEWLTDYSMADLEAEPGLYDEPPVLALRIHGSMSTKEWPIGRLLIDIEFTSPTGVVVSTDTAVFLVVKNITNL